MLELINGLLDINAYFSHVGTLQHKLAFFSLAGGVAHGPKAQMTMIEAGAYQAERGRGPLYLDQSMVVDTLDSLERGSKFNDYKIIDIKGAISRLRASASL